MASDRTFITAAPLTDHPGINHAFFTRQGGVSQGIFESRNIGLGSEDERDAVMKNRKRCAEDLGAPLEKLATPYQVHSADVITVTDVWDQGAGPKADALVTDKPGIAIGIATADCGPVLFSDPEARIIGAAHAGWRGATTGVLDNTVAAMEALGAQRERITAVLGPTIHQPSYEVGPEFVENLTKVKAENESYFVPSDKPDHAMFDLPAYIIDRLKSLGLASSVSLNLDTYVDEARFYSYRRTTHKGEPDYGRLLSAIIIRP